MSSNFSSCCFHVTSNLSKHEPVKGARSKVEIKTMKVSHKISEHDLQIKVGQMSSWLKSKCEVKVAIGADGSPGSKVQAEEILKSIQEKLPGSEAKQVVKKASGINFMLRLAGKSELPEFYSPNNPSAISVKERSEKIREELSKELSGMLGDLSDNKDTK